MNDRHRDILRRHWSTLRRDLEPMKLLPYLVNVLDVTDEQEVKIKATREDRIDKLLEILPRRGPKAFDDFVKALQEVQPFLAAPLVQESEMEEIKRELNRARTNSARLREEVHLIRTSLEKEQQKHKKTHKELDELKSIHETLMAKGEEDRQNMQTRVQDLETTINRLEEELSTERSSTLVFTEETARLRKVCDQMDEVLRDFKESYEKVSEENNELVAKLSHYKNNVLNETVYRDALSFISRHGEHEVVENIPNVLSTCIPFIDDEELEIKPRRQKSDSVSAELLDETKRDLARVTTEYEELKERYADLEKQLEDSLASLERHRSASFHDRATSPGEPIHLEFEENQECSQCKALEEECNLLTTEKDFFKEKKENFEDEVKKLNKEMKELRSDHLREKQALQKEIQSMREEHEKLSRDFEKELQKMLRDVNDQQESEMKALHGQNDDLNDQINKLKSENQKVMAQLKKEKSQLEKNQEDFVKAKKNLAREKKKLKETKEELGNEVNAKTDALKELAKLKNELCSQEKKRCEDIERLRKDFAERCKCDLLREEIQRLRNMSGRNNEVTKQGQPMEEINITEQDRNACQDDNDDAKEEDEDCILVKAADQAGNQACSRCHKLEKELSAQKTEMEQIKLKPNEEKTLVAEKLNRKAKLREANGRLDPVQENGQEEVIQKEREEKRKIESQLVSEKNAVEKELQEHKEDLVTVKGQNARLTKEINDHLKKIKEVENRNETLVKKNKDLRSRIKTGECNTSELCDELRAQVNGLSTELKKLRKEKISLKKENEDSLRKVKDLKEMIETLETRNYNNLSKITTETSRWEKLKAQSKVLFIEKERLAKANEKSLQRIERLQTQNNSLELKIKAKEGEIKQLRDEKRDSITKTNEKSLQRIKGLETENNSLELKIKANEREIKQLRKERDSIAKTNGKSLQNIKDLEKKIEVINKDKSAVSRVLNYRKDFDRHGVIYALGTNFGTTPWVNPGSNSASPTRIIATRSSDEHGVANDLLDNRRGGTLSGTKDEDKSWWCVDLSEKYALFLTHYTLRHGRDNGMSIIRNWRLEGSLDGRSWKVLKKHENDRGLKEPFPYYTATWSVDGDLGAFRYFRIFQTGKNSSGRFSIFLSGIELYGVLIKLGN